MYVIVIALYLNNLITVNISAYKLLLFNETFLGGLRDKSEEKIMLSTHKFRYKCNPVFTLGFVIVASCF